MTWQTVVIVLISIVVWGLGASYEAWKRRTVVVPQTEGELIEALERMYGKAGVKFVVADDAFMERLRRDFASARGGRYRAFWFSVRGLSVEDAFRLQGSVGNAAVFLAWITRHRRLGAHISVTADGKCLCSGHVRDPFGAVGFICVRDSTMRVSKSTLVCFRPLAVRA